MHPSAICHRWSKEIVGLQHACSSLRRLTDRRDRLRQELRVSRLRFARLRANQAHGLHWVSASWLYFREDSGRSTRRHSVVSTRRRRSSFLATLLGNNQSAFDRPDTLSHLLLFQHALGNLRVAFLSIPRSYRREF